jgi:hypothetical protein
MAKAFYNGKETIDLTPTWQGMLKYILTLLQDGTPEGRKVAEKELSRMAQAADNFNDLLKEKRKHDEKFPNGFTSWQETHYEIVYQIAASFYRNPDRESYGEIKAVHDATGTGGLYELAEQWTNEFETKNKGREWDGEFFDEIEEFFAEQNKK